MCELREIKTDQNGKVSYGAIIIETEKPFSFYSDNITDSWYQLYAHWRDGRDINGIGYLDLPAYFVSIMNLHRYYDSI